MPACSRLLPAFFSSLFSGLFATLVPLSSDPAPTRLPYCLPIEADEGRSFTVMEAMTASQPLQGPNRHRPDGPRCAGL